MLRPEFSYEELDPSAVIIRRGEVPVTVNGCKRIIVSHNTTIKGSNQPVDLIEFQSERGSSIFPLDQEPGFTIKPIHSAS